MTFRYGDRVSLDGEPANVLGVVHGAAPDLDLVTVQRDGVWIREEVQASRLSLIERPGLAPVSAQGDLFAEATA